MSRRKQVTEAFDESGAPVESVAGEQLEKKPKNARTWAIQGLRLDGSGMDVVAEGMTKGQTQKMLNASMGLLRRLYSKVRLVKTVIGEEYDL